MLPPFVKKRRQRETHPSIVENAVSTNHQTAAPPFVVKSKSLSDLGQMLADSGRSAFLRPAD